MACAREPFYFFAQPERHVSGRFQERFHANRKQVGVCNLVILRVDSGKEFFRQVRERRLDFQRLAR